MLLLFGKTIAFYFRCDVNVQDNKGQTPLHKAVEKEYSELVSILVHNDADPNLATNSGYFPLRIAVWNKNFDITQVSGKGLHIIIIFFCVCV